MEKYYEMAAAYFKQIEGRHLYPKLLSIHWIIWAISVTGFGYYVVTLAWSALFLEPIDVYWISLFCWELAFLASVFAIQIYKSRQLLLHPSAPTNVADLSVYKKEQLAKKVVLSEICGKDTSQFNAIAKEISDLRNLEKGSRSVFDLDLQDMLRSIYDPDSKARILSLFLALAALVVTLLKGSESAPLPDLIAEIHNQGGPWVFGTVLAIKGAYYFVILWGFVTALKQLVVVITDWFSKIGWSQAGNKTMLNRMLRDLVLLYDPTAKPKEEPATSSEQSTPTQTTPASSAAPIASLPTLAAGVLLGGLASLMWDRKDGKQ